MKVELTVSKRRHLKFRCREITQKNTTCRTRQKFETNLQVIYQICVFAFNVRVLVDKTPVLMVYLGIVVLN